MFDDFEHACDLARTIRFRRGRFIAILIVPEDGTVEFAKTYGVHHYTIYYGNPESILALVDGDPVPIPDAEGDGAMDSYYELFDVASGNVIEVYAAEREAIDALIEVVRTHGPEAIATFALTFVRSGRPTLVAMEDELVTRVQQAIEQLVPSHP